MLMCDLRADECIAGEGRNTIDGLWPRQRPANNRIVVLVFNWLRVQIYDYTGKKALAYLNFSSKINQRYSQRHFLRIASCEK
jgi:hypothetical protein